MDLSAVGAVVAAGGAGSRSGSPTLKQFHPLALRPMIVWALQPLLTFPCDPIVVALPEAALEEGARLLTEFPEVEVVPGGDDRQASVREALQHVHTETVVIHDAARPFADRNMVYGVLGRLDAVEGAVTALPLDETLKRVDDGLVNETVARRGLWRSQTPQAFRTQTLKDAHDAARRDGFVATDDAQLIENYGGRVAIVQGSRMNIKVTYPEDLELAEYVAEVFA